MENTVWKPLKKKQRLTALDIRGLASELNSELVGTRISNIYDFKVGTQGLQNLRFVFKFHGPNGKQYLTIYPGVSTHLSNWKRRKESLQLPSGFCMKLRKLLKTRKIERIDQVGADRVLRIHCAPYPDVNNTSTMIHLCILVELYSTGNILVVNKDTDAIVATLRTHEMEDISVKVGEIYSLEEAKQVIHPDLRQGLLENGSVKASMIEQHMPNISTEFSTTDLAKIVPFAHALLLEYAKTVACNAVQNKSIFEQYSNAANTCLDILASITPKELQTVDALGGFQPISEYNQAKGYLVVVSNQYYDFTPVLYDPYTSLSIVPAPNENLTNNKTGQESAINNNPADSENSITSPVEATNKDMMCQDAGDAAKGGNNYTALSTCCIWWFDTFSQCIDTYFTCSELDTLYKKQQQQQDVVANRALKILAEQNLRLEELELKQSQLLMYADILELNASLVDQAILLINTLVSSGASWDCIEMHIKNHRKRGHPIAQHIGKLNLGTNRVILLLPSIQSQEAYDNEEYLQNENDENATDEQAMLPICVDISLSALGNAELYHSERKKHKAKAERTREQSAKAIIIAEEKAEKTRIKQDLAIHTEDTIQLTRIRKYFWFEKFHWFISSDGFLVIAGRDAQQNEMIYRRYLQPNDIYVHADVHGASTCIIKNPNPSVEDLSDSESCPFPPSTIEQCAEFAVCRSAAWKQRCACSAWWVFGSQVSKTAPSGLYLSTGSFMVRGKRHFVAVHRLELGLGILWKLGDDESILRHAKKKDEGKETVSRETVVRISDPKEGVKFDDSSSESSKEVGKKKLMRKPTGFIRHTPIDDEDEDEDSDDIPSESPGVHETRSTGSPETRDISSNSPRLENTFTIPAQPKDVKSSKKPERHVGVRIAEDSIPKQSEIRSRRRKPTGHVSLKDIEEKLGIEAGDAIRQMQDELIQEEIKNSNPSRDYSCSEVSERSDGATRRSLSKLKHFEDLHVTFSPEPPKIAKEVLDALHVDFDGLPPEVIPALESIRVDLFGADAICSDKVEEEKEESDEEMKCKKTLRRVPTGWVGRSKIPDDDEEDEDEDEDGDDKKLNYAISFDEEAESTIDRDIKREDEYEEKKRKSPEIRFNPVPAVDIKFKDEDTEAPVVSSRPLDSSASSPSHGEIDMCESLSYVSSGSGYRSGGSRCSKSRSLSFSNKYIRRQSVDEGPPPSGYTEETLPTPRELLSHSSFDYDRVESRSESEKEPETDTSQIHVIVSSRSAGEEKAIHRHRSADHGPVPKGFICEEVPSARELLSLHLSAGDNDSSRRDSSPSGSFIVYSSSVPSARPSDIDEVAECIDSANASSSSSLSMSALEGLDSGSGTPEAHFEQTEWKDLNTGEALGSILSGQVSAVHKQRQSAASRKKGKKSDTVEESRVNFGVNTESIVSINDTNNTSTIASTISNTKSEVLPRGKRSKMQRAKVKYADQDEEERQERMQALQSAKTKVKTESDPTPIKKETRAPRFETPKSNYNADENDSLEFQEKLSQLDSLTSTPFSEDILLCAVPMVAPISALNGFAYKAKIIPGSLKKGKAATLCLKLFVQQAQHPVQKQLIKYIELSELSLCMVGDCQVQAAGLSKLQNAAKQKKNKQKN